ncbi:SLIT-ROBO Rho GTPase-activating protein 1-like isoform X2 [Ischnura elegans]|uniref:SLIT-ROBO Rho GTPase-activating protein 1-like isoform X2 n=1 Tax=Ischnura elegans TaxID=197161 RepID=UPI001ED89C2D|nr:SLIT-ROBO Rho GTPase-activating protein 1-like isoform X2 [Ischnura elegans]
MFQCIIQQRNGWIRGSPELRDVFPDIRAQLTEQVRCLDLRMETQVAIVGELQDYFRRRAEVELDYSKNLDKLARTLQLRHKEQRQKREQWPLFSSYSCWQQLLTQTRDLSRDHATLSEVYSNHLTARLSQVMEDVQRIYRKCRDIGFETHEEIFRVLHELHTSMKTCHAYAAECRQAHSKLRIATTQRLKMESAAPSKEKLARSKKYRLIEKEVVKRKSKYNDARLKAVKARNDYVLCLEAANTTVHKYFVDDLSDLIDCMDFGFHSCISRAMLMHISAGEWCGQGAKNGLDSIGSCVSSLDSRRDKRRFLEAHHAAFMIPKKFEFQHQPRGSNTVGPTLPPPTPGGGSSAAAAAMAGATEEIVVGVEGAPELQKVLREELEARLGQLRSRLTSLKIESEEVWKTLETAERTLLDMLSAKDYDCSHFFLQNSAATGPHLSSSTATISINESTQSHHPPVLVPPSSSSSSTSSSSSSSSSSLVSSVQASSGSSAAPTPCTGSRGQGGSGAMQTPSSSSSSALSQTGSGGSAGGSGNKGPETMSIKLRADRHETEEFYISKFREYLLGTSRIARLHAKHDHIQNVLLPSSSCGGPIGGRHSPTLPGISPMAGGSSNHSTLSNSAPSSTIPPSVPASGVLVLPRSVLGPGGSAAIVGRPGVVGGGGGGQQRRKRIGRLQLRMGQPKLFGGSLEEYLEATDMEIPLVVKSCIRVINLYGLHHQGIFRVSGSQVEINNFRESFERGEDPLADMTDASDINSVAGVLKLYLRELREPLFPIIYFEHFMELAQLESKHEFVLKMRELIQSLPRSVVVVLRYIFAFLNHLSEFSDENMMDPYNLAICFGPTLVPVPEDRDQVQYQNQVNDLIKNIILFNEDIFPDDGGVVYEKFISKEPDDNDVGDSPSDHVQEDLDSEVYPSEDETETLEATAQFDFLARSDRELSLKKGENIILYNQVSGDWWRGSVNGREGLVPDKYILLKIKDEDRDRLELLKSSSEESMRRRASSSNDSLLSGHSTTPLSSTTSASSSSAAGSAPVNGMPPPIAPEPITQDSGSPCKLDQSSPEPSPTQVQRVIQTMTPGPPTSSSTASSVFFPESKGEIVSSEGAPPIRSPSMSAVVEAVLAELPPEGEQMGLLTHQRSASEGPVSSGHSWGGDSHENGDDKHGGITDDSSVAGDTTEEECSSRPDTPVSTASEGDGIMQKGSNFHRASTTWKSQSVGEVGGSGGGVFGRNREAWQRRAASQSHLEASQQSAPSSTNISPAPSSLFRSSVEFWELRQKHTPDLVMDLPPTGTSGGKVEQEYGVGRRRRRKKMAARRAEGDTSADRDAEGEDEDDEVADDSSSSGSGGGDVGAMVITTSTAAEVVPEGGGSSSPGPESPDMTAAERFAKQNQCTLKKKGGTDAQTRKKPTTSTSPADSVEPGTRAISRTQQSNSSEPGLKTPSETAPGRSPGPVAAKFPAKISVSPSGSRPTGNAPSFQPPGVKPQVKAKPAILKKPVLPPHHSPELTRRVDKPEQN